MTLSTRLHLSHCSLEEVAGVRVGGYIQVKRHAKSDAGIECCSGDVTAGNTVPP